MSRFDGEWPRYKKLSAEVRAEPKDFSPTVSFQCAICGYRWPKHKIFSPSPCCQANVGAVPHPPALMWDKAIEEAIRQNFEYFYEEWNAGVSDEELLRAEETQAEILHHERAMLSTFPILMSI